MSTNFKSIKAERTTETRNTHDLETQGTGNIFETIVALSKRINQVALSLRKELAERAAERAAERTAERAAERAVEITELNYRTQG